MIQVTAVGVAFIAALALGVVLRRNPIPLLLAVGVALPHTAAVIIGHSSLSPFYLVAIAAAVHLVIVQVRNPVSAGDYSPLTRALFVALVVLVVYSLAVSLIAPHVFAGMPVFAPRAGIDSQVGNLTPLAFSISNLAQPAYLILGVVVAIYLGRIGARTRLIEIAFCAGVGLALVRLVAPAWWPVALFENSPNVTYTVTQVGLRGTFSEPSVFGLFLVAGIVYAAVAFMSTHERRRRIGLGLALAVMAVELAFNASWTAFAVLALVILAASAFGAVRLVRSQWQRPRNRIALLAAYAVVIVAAVAVTPVVTELIAPKLESASAFNRSASNAAAAQILLDSFGVGVGLGSNRPSSLLLLLLSCIGIIGTIAFVGAIVPMVATAWRARPLWAVAAALCATVTGLFISVPELSFPLLWMLAGLTLFSQAAGPAGTTAHRFDSARPAPSAA